MKNTVAVMVIIIILGIVLLFKMITTDRKQDIEVDSLEYSRYTKLENILMSSAEFSSSTIYPNADYTTLTVDGKYDVVIKTGYYMMTIKNAENEELYCKIVDAIETSLGAKENASIDTCQATLAGKMSLGGISAEIFENYKILTVSSEEPAKLIDPDNSHKENEPISTDKVDYTVTAQDNIITSIQTEYKEDTDNFSLCGNIFNTKKREDKLIFKIYDEAKNEITSKQYIYANDTKKYIPFCLDFTLEINNVKYYSVGGE